MTCGSQKERAIILSSVLHQMMSFYKKEGECLLRSTNCNFNYNRLVFVFLGLIFLYFIHHTVSEKRYIMSNKLAMMNKEETKQ